jgi:hypothetical protein
MMTMIKILVAVVGVLIAGGGIAAAWFATGSNDEITKIEAETSTLRNANARGRGGEAEDQKIQDRGKQEIAEKETERNIRYGVAGAGLLVGLSMALLPWVGKRKTSAPRPVAAPDHSAPSL